MEDAMRADKMLLELAMYSVTHGHQLDYKIKSQEEYYNILRNVDKRFAEFKRLIISGESSYDKLSSDCFAKYAVDLREFFATTQQSHPNINEPTIFGFGSHTQKANKKDNEN